MMPGVTLFFQFAVSTSQSALILPFQVMNESGTAKLVITRSTLPAARLFERKPNPPAGSGARVKLYPLPPIAPVYWISRNCAGKDEMFGNDWTPMELFAPPVKRLTAKTFVTFAAGENFPGG